MKKLLVAVFLLIGCAVFTAVWFSPLSALGTPDIYYDNAVISGGGLCYPQDATVRVDVAGGRERMYEALRMIDAEPVKEVEHNGTLTVYALSPRVATKRMYTSESAAYNVMASCDGDTVCIGTPVLAGCY